MALRDGIKHFRDFDGYSGSLTKSDMDDNLDMLADEMEKRVSFYTTTTTDATSQTLNISLTGSGFTYIVLEGGVMSTDGSDYGAFAGWAYVLHDGNSVSEVQGYVYWYEGGTDDITIQAGASGGVDFLFKGKDGVEFKWAFSIRKIS